MNEARLKKPIWLRKRLMNNQTLQDVNALLKQCDLHTVCEEAHCPNLGECFSNGTATFLILGNQCTRNCTFCAVSHGQPEKPDKDEPEMVASAVKKLGLHYVVITSVTRDDLPDGGARHFSETIEAVRDLKSDILIEVLIPDFKGSKNLLQKVVDSKPDVINHNVETVQRLYGEVRPQAVYNRSLKLLENVRGMDESIKTKSGFMVGLGEQMSEAFELLEDLQRVGCEIVTIGQYLAPSSKHHPIIRYVPPEEFSSLKEKAYDIGFMAVASGPFIRSSYFAKEVFQNAFDDKIET